MRGRTEQEGQKHPPSLWYAYYGLPLSAFYVLAHKKSVGLQIREIKPSILSTLETTIEIKAQINLLDKLSFTCRLIDSVILIMDGSDVLSF